MKTSGAGPEKKELVATLFAILFILAVAFVNWWHWYAYYRPLGIPWWAMH